MASIDVSINGSPVVAMTVTLGFTIPAGAPPPETHLWTAKATPVSTERIGTGQTERDALCECAKAIIDADEVPE